MNSESPDGTCSSGGQTAENSPLTPCARVLHSGLTQHFVAVYGAFMVFAFISTLPRGIVLLSISARDMLFADVQEVLEGKVGVGNIFAECKATDHAWTGLSPDGQFHKTMVISDLFFQLLGTWLTFVAGMCVTFTPMSRARKAVSLFFTICYLIIQIVGMILLIRAHNVSRVDFRGEWSFMDTVMYAPRVIMAEWGLYPMGIIFLGFFLLTIVSDRTSEGTPAWSISDMLKLGFSQIRFTSMVLLTVFSCYIFTPLRVETNTIQYLASNFIDHAQMSDDGWLYQFTGVILPLILGKSVLLMLRMIGRPEGSLPLRSSLMLQFMVNSLASMAARRFNFVDDNLIIVVLNCLVISAIEILSRLFIHWFHVLAMGTELQRARIYSLTLDELLHLHHRIQYSIDQYTGYMLIDHVTEIAACFTLTTQYLLLPQWVVSQPHDDYRTRVFSSFAVQMVFELVVAFVHVYSSHRGVESLVPFRVLCERVLWNRHLILFSFGVVIAVQGIQWWPKCTTCGNPWECLLFIECSRGPVKLGTDSNVCGKYRRFQNNTNLELLAIHNIQRRKHGFTHNLTLEDLACASKNVDCGEWTAWMTTQSSRTTCAEVNIMSGWCP